jgi:hypothetical protein
VKRALRRGPLQEFSYKEFGNRDPLRFQEIMESPAGTAV